jgi:hypothetical protein
MDGLLQAGLPPPQDTMSDESKWNTLPPPPRPRSAPGDFEILEELGRGGMGVVYKAQDPRLKRVVALKQLLSAGQASAEQLARFRSEAEAVARLAHPHIVQVFQAGEHNGVPFLVLEFVPGGSLDRRLGRDRPESPQDSARLVLLLARAMHAAHQAGVVHRDLKPANVLLATPADEPALNTAWGCPKVSDFGLARLRDEADRGSVSGAVLGTPAYMAPEQAEGRRRDIGPATDVWALGVILYQLLTGRLPFRGESLVTTMRRICSEEPEPMRRLRPEVPEALEAVVRRCLSKPPEERYPSAAVLADDLKEFLDGSATGLVPTGRLKGGRRPRPAVWLAFAAGVALAAVGVTLGLRWAPGTPTSSAVAEPLKAELGVQVWTRGPGKKGLRVEEQGSGALPVRNGEMVRLTAKLNRPAFVYLIWIDAEGSATALYPWNDNDDGDVDNDLASPPPDRPRRQEVNCPQRERKGFPVAGKSGLVTALLLAREQPLPAGLNLAEILRDMKANLRTAEQPLPQELAVRGFDRGRVNEEVRLDRNRGLKKAQDIDDAVAVLRDRLSEYFEVIRTVSFAQVGEP